MRRTVFSTEINYLKVPANPRVLRKQGLEIGFRLLHRQPYWGQPPPLCKPVDVRVDRKRGLAVYVQVVCAVELVESHPQQQRVPKGLRHHDRCGLVPHPR